jgi:hypothetical protein
MIASTRKQLRDIEAFCARNCSNHFLSSGQTLGGSVSHNQHWDGPLNFTPHIRHPGDPSALGAQKRVVCRKAHHTKKVGVQKSCGEEREPAKAANVTCIKMKSKNRRPRAKFSFHLVKHPKRSKKIVFITSKNRRLTTCQSCSCRSE